MKTCTRCHVQKSPGKFAYGGRNGKRRAWCKSCFNEYSREHRAKNVDGVRAKQRIYKAKIRIDAIKHYGGNCACCGENLAIFLAIDHINGGGTKHALQRNRPSIGGWLKARNYPEGFQVLCHNCNYAKSHGGCPHAELR